MSKCSLKGVLLQYCNMPFNDIEARKLNKQSEARRESKKRYCESENGRESKRRYEQSDNGKQWKEGAI